MNRSSKITSFFFFLCTINIIVYGAEEHNENKSQSCKHSHESSLWDSMNHPLIGIAVGYAANKFIIPHIIDPMIDGISSSCYNVYFSYWLTPEEQKKIQLAQEQKGQLTIENFEKANLLYQTQLMETERGRRLLIKKEEQVIKIGEQTLRDNERELAENDRTNLLEDLEMFKKLMNETTNNELQKELEQQRDEKIRRWANR